jgi:hypothetical protein
MSGEHSDERELTGLISASLAGLRKLYAQSTSRTADSTHVTEKEFLRLMHDVILHYTIRPTIVEIYQNVFLLERCVAFATPRLFCQGGSQRRVVCV